jgi:uncharacterized membrane protein
MDQPQVLSKSCPHCEFKMPEMAAFCPGCGRSMQAAPRAQGKVGILPENIAGAIAYLTFVPAVIFLLAAPYRKNRFVRFHSVQCLLAWGAGLLLAGVLKLISLVLFIIPVLGPLLVVLIDIVVVMAVLLIWLVLLVKAIQGEMFWLPLLGDFADRYADVI